MTKEQLIKEFRERFTFQKGGVWMDGKTYMVPFEIQAFLLSAFDAGEKNGIVIGRASGIEEVKVTENTSDGYHTFKELYEFRKVYNVALFNEWTTQGKYQVHKSKKHSDGELCFGGGWFIVSATLPTGQISNHYELKDWDLFECEERPLAEKWDGHTPADVVKRLLALTPSSSKDN